MSELIGKELGPYRIIEQIGVGGMATVYRAYHATMDRFVAVKVLPEQMSAEPGFRKRFEQEAKVIAKLEHARILPVYDYGEDKGRLYLVMRHVEAGTLKDRLAAGPSSLAETARILRQVGGALAYAHRMGVIHRDVKPSNVLLDANGDCFLTDFGLAKIMEASIKLTATGVGLGTPAYMSPEQGQGVRVDNRSDIYSLGVMLYEMVTGRVPYEAETPMAVVLKHMAAPLPLPHKVKTDVPAPVERVLLKALAKNPEDRFQTVDELVEAFDAAARMVGTEAQAVQLPDRGVEIKGPARALPARSLPALREALGARWGRIALLTIGGVILLVALVLILSRIPFKVQLSGGRVEVVRVVEETATAMVAAAEMPASIPAATPPPGLLADQARAFAEPILAAIADRPPDYEDDFGDPGSGWPIGSSDVKDEWGYKDGAYFILVGQGKRSASVPQPDRVPHLSDFVMEVDAQFISGESGLWGVIFRDLSEIAEPADHYAIGFWPDGHFRVWKNIGGNHIELLARDASPVAFKEEFETNHLAIIAQGPQITFYVNGEPLWFIHDESVSRGGIQLLVENIEADSSLRVRFDNFKVWDISDLELPSAEATPAPLPTVTAIPTEEEAAAPTPPPLGRIVYSDGKTGNDEIYVVNSDGSDEHRLTDNPAGDWLPAWSPDGTRIVFDSDHHAIGKDRNQLYVMDADGSNLTRLTYTDGNEEHPSWSPDGSRIAFHSGCSLAVVNTDGSNWTTLVEARDDLCVGFPTWSPDSRRIAFRSLTYTGDSGPYQHDIYVANDDGSGLLKLASFTSEERGRYVIWSPDGGRVAFDIVLDGQQKYYAVNADGSGEPVKISSIPTSWYPWYWPQWEGETTVAPPINPTDQRGQLVECGDDLCILTADGNSVSLGLATSYTQFTRSTWSPDGSQIAFSACLLGNEDSCEELYVADLTTGAVTRLPRQGENHHPLVPAWSPNGEWIAYHDSGALSVVRPDGTGHREIVPHPYCPTNIAWSPDNQRLAWFAHWCDEDETSPALLLVVNFDGSDMRLLWTRDDANPHGSDVAFSPDGTTLVVRFDDGSVYQVDPECDPGPDGCDASSRTEMDRFPEHWLHTYWPQWDGKEGAFSGQSHR